MIEINLAGKNALVTGGTRGIGRAISRVLAQAGASTMAVYRADQASAAESLTERQAFVAGQHANIACDLASEENIVTLPELIRGQFGGTLDILVHNAAMQGRGTAEDFPTEQWRRMIDVNLTSAFLLAKHLLPLIGRGGSIVLIASGAGHDPMAGLSAYGASKAGLILYAADLAQDIGPRGIRVNAVSPGSTDVSPNPTLREVSSNALRRQGVADDIARAVLFFCSDLAGFVTGQTLRVNGGAF